MNHFRLLLNSKYLVLIWAFNLLAITLHSQKGFPEQIRPNSLPTINDNNLLLIQDDTTTISALTLLMQKQCKKQIYLDLDSVRLLVHTALGISKRLGVTNWNKRLHDGMAWAYFIKNFQDSARYYYKLELIEAEQKCSLIWLWEYNTRIGMAFHYESNYDSAIALYNKAIEYAIDLDDTSRILSTTSKLANLYMNKGNYPQTVNLSLEIIKKALLSKDTFQVSYNYGMLAALYGDMKLYENEMKMARAGFEYVKYSKDSNAIFWSYNAFTNTYLNQKVYDSVLYYSRLSIQSFRSNRMIPYCWLNMADGFYGLNQIDSAIFYYNKILNEFQSNTIKVDVNIYLGLGKCALKKGDWPLAEVYLKKAEDGIDNVAYWNKKYIYEALSNYYDETHQYKLSLFYYKKFKADEDSVLVSQKALSIGTTVSDYETRLMAEQLRVVQKEKQIQTLLTAKQKQQKNLVYASSSVLLSLLLFGFIRYRKYREIKYKQVLMNERLRISRDLHDEVGATLGGIAMYSHLAKSQLGNSSPSALTKSLDTIQQSSTEMVVKLSDIVWLINPAHDSLKQLMEKLEDHAKRIAATKHAKVIFILPKELKDISLPVESRRNIYLIFKEAIHNSMKYSQATIMEMKADVFDQTIQLVWHDNGIGFDPNQIPKGNGMSNMRNRAEDIQANLELQSTTLSGTKIIFQCKVPQ